jgi:hypothetical protein
VQDHRIGGFERVDRHAALGALAQQPLRRVQTREIVEESGDARAIGVDPVDRGEPACHPRNPQHVRIAMPLAQRLTHAVRGTDELDAGQWRTSR